MSIFKTLRNAQWLTPTAQSQVQTQHPLLSRRALIKGLAGSTGLVAAESLLNNPLLGSSAPSWSNLAWAQSGAETPDRYYIFCYFSGGWDILLGLDPRDPRTFTNENRRLTLIQPGYEFLDGVDRDIITSSSGVQFGPHIGELLRHQDRLAVIRGMSMETLTHEVGRRRFLTGRPPSGLQARGSSASTWLASHLGEAEPIPNLSVRVEAYNQDLPNFASALSVGNTSDLLRTLTPTEPVLPQLIDRQIDYSLRDASQCAQAKRSAFWQAAEEARIKSRDMIKGGYADRFNFSRPEHEALRSLYNITNVNNDSAEIRGALAVQAICSGMSRCVSVQVANGLDTHFDNWESDQGAFQERGFNVVARMVDDLSAREYKNTGSSWLDHTVIVGFSEFSRTPLLNDNGGRDHSLTNASFLIGGNIRGGQAIGASSNVGMQPMAVNLQNGRALNNPSEGEVIRPEHVLQTLFHEVGLPESRVDLRVDPIAALI
jgi:uncharacterized protein (DUF1501 family)